MAERIYEAGSHAVTFACEALCSFWCHLSCFRVGHALSCSDHVGGMSLPATGWSYCGCLGLPTVSNSLLLLLSKRFGVFPCSLSMHSKNTTSTAPMQKTTAEQSCCHSCSLASTGRSNVPVGWRQGLLGPPDAAKGQGVESKCGTEKGTGH